MHPQPRYVSLLRQGADALAEDANAPDPVNFPGWDVENLDPTALQRCHDIRDAAWAILGNTNFDSGVDVTKGQVEALIHYIADMLSE